MEAVKAEVSDNEQVTGFGNAPEAMVVSQVEPVAPVVHAPVSPIPS